MRLADVDWMRAHIKPYDASEENWLVTMGTVTRLMHKLLDIAPTIDAVSVIRCKDCDNCRELDRTDKRENQYVEGVVWCKLWDEGVYSNDFCSYGCKRETF